MNYTLALPAALRLALQEFLLPQLRRVLVTAGPTHEPIDSVRYIANRSSGRMGLALAKAATQRGWPTTLLLGPTPLEPPEHSQLRTIRFQTTAELQQLLSDHWPRHDVLFMAAAVADYRLKNVQTSKRLNVQRVSDGKEGKLPRKADGITLDMEATPDLLAGLASITRPDQLVIGFALEPKDRLIEAAAQKLKGKGLDAIVANPLETMDSEQVSATVLTRDGKTLQPPGAMRKADFAEWLFEALPSISTKAKAPN